MRTVVHFPSEAAALVDVCTVSMALEQAGWRRLHFESDTLIQDTWQHDEHAHDIVCRWTRNLCDSARWDRAIDLVWWHWPDATDSPTTATFRLPVDVPVEAACESWDGQPITLPTVIAMCGVIDLRDVA